jgi:hypothetical protein
MIDVLKGADYLARALPAPPTKRWMLETLRDNLNKVITYRRQLPRKIMSQHLLMKLLDSLAVDLRSGDQTYVWGVEDVALKVANSLRMTSLYGHGLVFSPGAFYGPQAKEIVITTIDAFNIKEARTNWKDLMPIRVITHGIGDFTLPYLDGSGEGIANPGWVVIAINVPMLAFQHKCWWEEFAESYPDSPLGLNVFLSQYPLANLLRSHLDITLLNRTMSMDFEANIPPQKDPNPFYLNFQQAGQVDRTILYALTFMSRSNLSFDDWLDCIPQVSAENVHDWLVLPDLMFTTQVEWAFFVARLPVMTWLLAHNASVGSSFNTAYVVAIRHWVQRMSNGRFYHQGLRGSFLEDILKQVNEKLMPYL